MCPFLEPNTVRMCHSCVSRNPEGLVPPTVFRLVKRGTLRGCPEIAKSGCWQPTEVPHPVAKTLQKQGVSEILWRQAGTARIGENGFSGQPLRYFLDSRFRENDILRLARHGRGKLLHSAKLTVSTGPNYHNLWCSGRFLAPTTGRGRFQ